MVHTPTRRLSVLGLMLLLVITAACGGDDPPLTEQEYRAEADAICAQTNTELDAIPDPVSAADILDTLDAARPIVEAQLERLKGLNPPDELANRHNDAIALLEEQLEVTGSVRVRIDAGESAFDVVNEVVPRLEEINVETDDAARALQLTVCGQQDPA